MLALKYKHGLLLSSEKGQNYEGIGGNTSSGGIHKKEFIL